MVSRGSSRTGTPINGSYAHAQGLNTWQSRLRDGRGDIVESEAIPPEGQKQLAYAKGTDLKLLYLSPRLSIEHAKRILKCQMLGPHEAHHVDYW